MRQETKKTFDLKKHRNSFVLLLVFSSFICSLLRSLKDTLLITKLGVEEISFIKFYGVLPFSIIFLASFTKIANLYSRAILYQIIILFFIIFYCLYFLTISFDEKLFIPLNSLKKLYPSYKHFISLVENWRLSLFYIVSEVCGTVILTLIYWQFINDIYKVKQAKTHYFSLGIVGQIGIIIAGITQNLSTYIKDNELALKLMLICIIFVLIILYFTYKFLFLKIETNLKDSSSLTCTKLSLFASAKLIFTSLPLVLIMLMMYAYGLASNLADIVWKLQIKSASDSLGKFSLYLSSFNMALGLASIICMYFGKYLISRFNWFLIAITPPIILGILGFFFIFLVQNNNIYPELNLLLGAITIILFKSLNYAFIDTSKEISFIAMCKEVKVKGKAAIDILGARMGKASGALIQQYLVLNLTASLLDSVEKIIIIFMFAILFWLASVSILNRKLFNKIEIL